MIEVLMFLLAIALVLFVQLLIEEFRDLFPSDWDDAHAEADRVAAKLEQQLADRQAAKKTE